MGLLDFSKLPANTLIGADWQTFRGITMGRYVAPEKKVKMYITKCICRFLSLFAPFQECKYRKKLANVPLPHDPIFILGHWRSGTTFVHNVFAQDSRFGYTTTYQTVFPHYMMSLQWVLKPLMKIFIPSHRPTDKMELHPDLPQEEEFALELRARDRERKLIKKIDKTLTKLDNDDYGYCDHCGSEIGIKRLEARPTADLCVDCKALAEIKEKQLEG